MRVHKKVEKREMRREEKALVRARKSILCVSRFDSHGVSFVVASPESG